VRPARPLACTTFLQSFEPVSIKMAKQQDLRPETRRRLSGLCGRLKCLPANTSCRNAKGVLARRLRQRGRAVDNPVPGLRQRRFVASGKLLDRAVSQQLETGSRSRKNRNPQSRNDEAKSSPLPSGDSCRQSGRKVAAKKLRPIRVLLAACEPIV